MKRTILSLFILIGLTSQAEIVRLQWDKSTTPDVSYTLNISPTNSPSYKVNVGTNLVTTLNLTNRTVINVRALKDGIESDPSNDVTWQPTPVKPGSPNNLRIVITVDIQQ